jgi:uncharacterized protein (TIGR00255 family)
MSPIRSMTGFGRSEVTTPLGVFCVEIKAVNHRFLDARVHLPREFSALEIPMLKTVKDRVGRGKLEVLVRWTPAGGTAFLQRFNRPALEVYQRDLREMAQSLGHADGPSFEFLLGLPGVAEKEFSLFDSPELLEQAQQALNEALDELLAERLREGRALVLEFLERLDALERLRLRVEERQPEVTEAYRARLDKRAEEWAKMASVELDKIRLETEVLMFAERADVREELVRLNTHLAAFRQMLDLEDDKSQGRQMEFLCQELLREANTIASKARDTAIISSVLEMKNEIEKIREQIMNIE